MLLYVEIRDQSICMACKFEYNILWGKNVFFLRQIPPKTSFSCAKLRQKRHFLAPKIAPKCGISRHIPGYYYI